MKARFEGILSRYGQSVLLINRKTNLEKAVQAFVQPVLKRREELPFTATPLGAVSGQRWLYIGPSGCPLQPGDEVSCGQLRLAVQEVQTVLWRNEPLYCRAMLRQRREVAE